MLPNRVEDLIDFVVGKLCDLLDVPHTLNVRWNPDREDESSS
jgi:3-polyprenyl-4-hydroxybenzoate decarboxylase